MPLSPGTHVGPYEVVGPLGAGGMGEVYRARDARLERDVALKVLPESFAHDADRLARFEREAGQSIVYRKGVDLYTRPLGGGTEQPFVVDGLSKDPRGWSPDGSAFVYRVSAASGNSDIWVKPASGEPRPLVTSPFTENYAEFSPDGRWLAYVSEESGVSDVYVTSFPSGQGKWRVSPNGGTLPRWRADGRELYYLTLAGELMAAEVRAGGASFDVDVPTLLFPTRAARSPGYQYVVTADGSRFLINETLPLAWTPSIDIIVNWPSLLKGAR